MTADKEKTYSVSGKVLSYGILVTFMLLAFIAIVAVAVGGLALERSSGYLEQNKRLTDSLLDSQTMYGECRIELSRAQGELEAFRGILVNPRRTAIVGAVDEYEKVAKAMGGEMSVEQFKKWVESSNIH